MAKFDLKGTYAVYLSAMYRNPEGITAAKLAELCCRDKADVSRAVAALEAYLMSHQYTPLLINL